MWSKRVFSRLFCVILLAAVVAGCRLPLPGWLNRFFQKGEPDPLAASVEKMRDASNIPLEISFEDGFPASVIGAFPAAGGDAGWVLFPAVALSDLRVRELRARSPLGPAPGGLPIGG